MDKIKFKKQIFDSAKSLIEEKITHFQKKMARLENDNLSPESDQFELVQKSQDEAAHELTDKFTRQLNFAREQLMVLERLGGHDHIMNKVSPGAVVVTDKYTFYVSVATDGFSVDGRKIMGLSQEAPIYRAMHEKKKGDSFVFRDNTYIIEDLF